MGVVYIKSPIHSFVGEFFCIKTPNLYHHGRNFYQKYKIITSLEEYSLLKCQIFIFMGEIYIITPDLTLLEKVSVFKTPMFYPSILFYLRCILFFQVDQLVSLEYGSIEFPFQLCSTLCTLQYQLLHALL